MNKKIIDLAGQKYGEGVQRCKSKEEISEFCQILCILVVKTIHGIEGNEFKKDFIRAAVEDNEAINPVMVN